MTDPDLRDALKAYTSGEPPLTFTFDQVVAGGRRVRRRRRLAVAGVTAVLVAAGGVVLGRPPAPAPQPLLPAGPSWAALDPGPFCARAGAAPVEPLVEPTTVVSERNGFAIRIPAEPAGHTAARISCYLATVVPPLLPEVTFHRAAAAPEATLPLQAYPGRVFDPADPGETTPPYVTADAVVADARGVGSVGFGSIAAYESSAEAVANCAGDGCSVRTGPNGETVIVLDTTAASGYRTVRVSVYRGDTIGTASASNGVLPAVPAGEAIGDDELTPGRPDPLLGVDQLIAVAAGLPS
ncbi:hypothetical protein [Actinoplanes sp. G11-F43]|uniref:hypothetical protein n=1 Tax=Actinoplanes sp. G11-F43 TaxID=3424130 RepID=UPI003D32D61A